MNNNADLSDVKTAITNGQQRAANVKYHNIVNGYQAALQVVDDVVLKNYIGNLTKMPVVPLSKDILENNIKNNVLFFKITEMVYEKEEFATYKFASVFNSLATTESAVFVIIDSDGIKTDFYMGVRSLDSERTTSSLRDTVENAMKGQFPGIKTTDYTIEEMESILEKIQANSISSVSCVANSKAHTIESNKNFVQGLEKLVLSMQGEKYTGIIIANGTTSDQLRELRKGYESVYTQMSPFATTQVNYMGNKTVNYTFTETEGKSRSTSHTTNSSESETETTSSGSSITNGESKESVAGKTLKGISSAASIIGAALGPLTGGMSLAVGGVVAGGVGLLGNAVQKTVSNSTTVNESISHSIAKVSGVSDGITEGVNYGTSKSEGYTNGMSEGMTLTLHDKSVETMLERIDKQLKRIDEFESLGMYECAAYFLSENQYAAEVAASTYKALMRGENSGVEISAVNSWGKSEKEITKQIGQYVTNFIHPVFRYEGTAGNIEVTPCSLVSGSELAIHMGLPRRSVCGLPVIEHADFGKEVVKTMHILKEKGAKVSFDPNVRLEMLKDPEAMEVVKQVYRESNIFMPGVSELKMITGEDELEKAIKKVFEDNKNMELLVLKNGSKGSEIYGPDGLLEKVGVYPVTQVDATGAGDSYDAAFICGLAEGKNVKEAAQMGAAAGALNAAAFGPMEGNISRVTVKEMIKLHEK